MIPVLVEVGSKRTCAAALEWPGWLRFARDEAGALAALEAYVPRYAQVAELAGIALPRGPEDRFEVVERLPGSATTDFGAPEAVATGDRAPLGAGQAERMVSLVKACWVYFDRVVAGAPAELRKGPRGGGRDRDKMVAHVLSAETAYLRKLGERLREPSIDDIGAIEAQRRAVSEVLSTASGADAPVERRWPQRTAARRIAWHVLDHAWEMEDRSEPF